MDDLEPCPFCGGRAKIQRGAYTKYVMCLSCEVMGPNLADDSELIAAWNRRAPAEVPQEVVKVYLRERREAVRWAEYGKPHLARAHDGAADTIRATLRLLDYDMAAFDEAVSKVEAR